MIDIFSKQDFENYLKTHQPFISLGLVDGEECYNIILDNQVSIIIRSSIKSDGLSADVGKDSIRCWLVSGSKPLGSKISKWTTRQSGWQDRLSKNIKALVLWRTLAGDCKDCGQPKGIFRARTEKNKGRPFAKCKDHNGFVWLDEPIKKDNIYFSEESHDTSTSEITKDEILAYNKEEQSNKDIVSTQDASKLPESTLPKRQSSDLHRVSEKIPNSQQEQAIKAPVNANVRLLAGPGSGKTYVIEHRYKYLVDRGISPKNILVCTFSKQMADEMGKRIQQSCPEAILEQISTIHAFCYRALCKWYPDNRHYNWKVPKDWKVKKCLEDAIGVVWQEKEKPNAQEVFDCINTSKYLGLNTDDSYEWFSQFGPSRGEWLYDIRCRLDAFLNRGRFLTFSDMLFQMEQRLKLDEQWRTTIQERFSHVIIDEAQDTNYQAMRILITISLESGKNTVYKSEEINNDVVSCR